MKFVIMHQTITTHDAIGNAIGCMHSLLKRRGHDVHVYCEHLHNETLEGITLSEFRRISSEVDCTIIYHHSNYWEFGEQLLDSASSRVVIRYHNITPARYFEGYNEDAFEKCSKGREQTLRFATKYPRALWLSDSVFNLAELGLSSRVDYKVLPPFNNMSKLTNAPPCEDVLKGIISNHCINLLFVGRVAPNKNYEFLLKIVYDYKARYGDKIRLHLIGKMDEGTSRYNRLLKEMVSQASLSENVFWVGEINDSILSSYFIGCDLFISASLHEGFFVPLVEAQSLSLPVIAFDSSVIRETMGEGGICLNEDVQCYSSAINVVMKDRIIRQSLMARGLENYSNRFTLDANSAPFYEIIENVG